MITLAAATFLLVFLRAWQQQNVTHGYYWWAFITSYGLALADVLVVMGVVKHGLAAVPFVGTGGAVGVICAMLLHRKIRK
jgi:hypothetical protein